MRNILPISIILLLCFSTIIPIANSIQIHNKKIEEVSTEETVVDNGLMDSAWPMKCHDVRHTGLSPYSTADNPGIEKWRFRCGWVEDGIVIGDDGTLYFGDEDWDIYAMNSDGTLKWEYRTGGDIDSSPAIAEDGTIYVGNWGKHLHAFDSSNGTRKWRFYANSANIASSPAIAEDGTIYFGTHWSLGDGGKIHAVNPNGTEKWRYQTGNAVISDPAIGDDGTIYIGSMDDYLYALYPNGTLRWRFKTGDVIKGPPSISIDGTIYIGSYDGYLYALHPNGTLKWKCGIGYGTETNPSIASDGTIYVGGQKLYAVYPDGTIRWSFDLGPGSVIFQSSPAISADGTIYVGTNINGVDGGDIIAVNPDGTENWRKRIGYEWVDSSPCIAEDGTVYIGSTYDPGKGYLHAFGSVDSNAPPETPSITGTTNGNAREDYFYYFTSTDPDNNPVSFYVDWGDGTTTGWDNEGASDESVWVKHTYTRQGTFTIKAKARDTLGEESDWATLSVSMPRNKPYINTPFLNFLESHPILYQLFQGFLQL